MTTEQSPGLQPLARVVAGQRHRPAQLQRAPCAEPPAEAPGPARAFVEAVAVMDQRVASLKDLDGSDRTVAVHHPDTVPAVAPCPAAPALRFEHQRGERLARPGMRPGD